MLETAIVCPFCNCRIDRGVDRAKPACPRCDAPLPADIVAKLAEPAFDRRIETPRVPGKKKTILAVLGVMLFMASITVAFTLWTQNFRRQNDYKKGFIPTEAATSVPEELNSLGLIPARCNILAAVNLVDLRANSIAKKSLLDPMPRTVAWLAERLKDSTGLTLDDLEQVAVGVEMTDKLPKIYVVVQTRTAFDPQAILKSFAPAKVLSLRTRPLVRFSLPFVGDGVAWCLSERHVAFLFRAEPGGLDDLEAIPVKPRQKLEGSPEQIKALVKDRVDKQSLAWVAADLRSVAGLVDLLSLVNARVDQYRPLLEAKALAVNVKTDRDVVLIGHVLPTSEKNAEKVENWLRDVDWRGATPKFATTPPEAKAEPWVTLQLRYEPAALRELLEKGPGLKKAD